MRGDALYVGGDDSNHAGCAKGEILVVTFSYDPPDSIKRKFPNKRDTEAMKRWLSDPTHDYRVTVLTDSRFRERHRNLPLVMPALIKSYLKDRESQDPETLKIYLDGTMKKLEKALLRKDFSYIDNVVVDNFIKKGKNRKGRTFKRPNCPRVVYMADIIANDLYRNTTTGQLFLSDKMVSIPLEELLKREGMIERR